jgi:arylformamidase
VPRFYDLSYGFDEDSFHPFGLPSFRNVQAFSSHGCRHAYVTFSLHTATHIDAPWHMVEHGRRLDAVDVNELVGDAVVLDLSVRYAPEKAASEGISVEAIEEALSSAGLQVTKGEALILFTGWARIFKSNPTQYYRDYCTLSHESAQWVIDKGIRIIGFDAPDVDLPGQYTTTPFPAQNHRLVLGSGVFIIENVGGQVEEILNSRVYLIPAPLKVEGEFASGAPVRLLAQL